MIGNLRSIAAAFVLLATVGGNLARAGVVVGIYKNPAATTGVAMSARSGLGTGYVTAVPEPAPGLLAVGTLFPGGTSSTSCFIATNRDQIVYNVSFTLFIEESQ